MDFQARQIMIRMNAVEHRVRTFAQHARFLQHTPLDPRDLLTECNLLMRDLLAEAETLEKLEGQGRSAVRSLPSRPPKSMGVGRYSYVGPPPRAQWGSEIRAAQQRCAYAIQDAAQELHKLRGISLEGLNLPTRTATSPGNLIDLIMMFVDLLTKVVENEKKRQ